MTPEPRTECAVPFCKRGQRGQWLWYLCPEHYRPIPMWIRARARRLKASGMKRGDLAKDKTSWWAVTKRGRRIQRLYGQMLVRAACRRAAGL